MPERLRYLGPEQTPRDTVDRAIDWLILKTVKSSKVTGLEYIPRKGPFVLGFLPHSGFIEVPAIDEAIRKVRPPPVWVTKDENVDGIPSIIRGKRRLIFIDREHPSRDTFEIVSCVLINPSGIVATAWEGTRFGRKAEDPNDVLTLAPVKEGLTLMAAEAGVPIVTAVVLGADKVLSRLDQIYAQGGKKAVIKALYQALTAKNKPSLTVDFLPPYTDHILPPGDVVTKKHRHFHTQQIIETQAIPAILDRNPNYPLGPYNYLRPQTGVIFQAG